MMRGLFTKTLHEVWAATLLFGFALLAVKALLTYILPQVQGGLDGIFDEIPMFKPLITALLGTELGDEITARAMQAFLWVHPVVLALLWAHEITFCTRFPAGEIDRGTIDVLLGLPASRRAIYLCESIVWLGSGLFILLMGFLGHRLAAPAMPEEMRPELSRAVFVITNLFCVYVAVGGISFLVSALSDRRGRAIATIFFIVLASFLLNFVAQFWDPAKQIAFLSVMEYYQPARTLQSGEFPSEDVAILLAVGGSTLLLGGEVVAPQYLHRLIEEKGRLFPVGQDESPSGSLDSRAVEFESTDISDGLDFIQTGTKVLTVQGLNRAADDPDFLVSALLDGVVVTPTTE